jgi:hypothetical protein
VRANLSYANRPTPVADDSGILRCLRSFWVGFLGVAFVRNVRDGSVGAAVGLLAMMAVGGIICSVNWRLRVIADPDGLHIRNIFRERHVDRADIAAFMDHAPGGLPSVFGGVIAVRLNSERLIDLRATSTGLLGRSRMKADLTRLQNWLHG